MDPRSLPLPALGKLPFVIEPVDSGIAIQIRSGEFAKRGIGLAIVIPILSAFASFLLFVILTDGETVGLIVVSSFGGLLALSGIARGVWMLARAKAMSRETRVTFSLAQDSSYRSAPTWLISKVTARGTESIPFDAIHHVRARRRSAMQNLNVLEVVDPYGRSFIVFDKLLTPWARDLGSFAWYIGAIVERPVDTGEMASSDPLGMTDEKAATACYLPIQGIFLIASVYFVFTAKNRPLVHFSALQSLCQFTFSIVVLGVILGAVGTPLALVGEGPLKVGFGALLGILLVAFFVWNLVTHIYACTQSWKGRAWVMPWLSPVIKHWRP